MSTLNTEMIYYNRWDNFMQQVTKMKELSGLSLLTNTTAFVLQKIYTIYTSESETAYFVQLNLICERRVSERLCYPASMK